jgi:hypothetical protein
MTNRLYFQRPSWSYAIRQKDGKTELWKQQSKWHITLTTEPRKRRHYKALCTYKWDSIMNGVNLRAKITNPKILCAKCAKALEQLLETESQLQSVTLIREAFASLSLDRDQTIDLGPQEDQ